MIGHTALEMAASNGHLEVVHELARQGTNTNNLNRSAIEAAQFNHRETVRFLQQQGADLTILDSRGRTAEDWLAVGGVVGHFKNTFSDRVFSSSQVRGQSEQYIRKLMSEGLSADEYAAKHGRHILLFSYGSEDFDDPEVNDWAHRVAEILRTASLLEQCEEQYLQGEERDDARKCRMRRTKVEARRKTRGKYAGNTNR